MSSSKVIHSRQNTSFDISSSPKVAKVKSILKADKLARMRK